MKLKYDQLRNCEKEKNDIFFNHLNSSKMGMPLVRRGWLQRVKVREKNR